MRDWRSARRILFCCISRNKKTWLTDLGVLSYGLTVAQAQSGTWLHTKCWRLENQRSLITHLQQAFALLEAKAKTISLPAIVWRTEHALLLLFSLQQDSKARVRKKDMSLRNVPFFLFNGHEAVITQTTDFQKWMGIIHHTFVSWLTSTRLNCPREVE